MISDYFAQYKNATIQSHMCRLCVCITSLKEEETENHPQTGGVEIAMMILLQCACKQACYPS
jgi:hypothetical protein